MAIYVGDDPVISMNGYPGFDEVSVVIFTYGDPGDGSLDLKMNYVMAIHGASITEQVSLGDAGKNSQM